MKSIQTSAIVLSRTNYGEADRIITFLTPGHGKLRLMARGVRKAKSKVAGGIELFSTSELSFIHGRGEIGTLVSARLIKYYSSIVHDIDRVQLGYDLIKMLHRATEDEPEPEYYELLEQAFQALDTQHVPLVVTRLWFEAQLLRLSGHTPNLHTDTAGRRLTADQNYGFDFENMSFAPHSNGKFSADHIKLARLAFSSHPPRVIAQVKGVEDLLPASQPLIQTMLKTHIRL